MFTNYWKSDERREASVDDAGFTVDQHNTAMSRATDAALAVLKAQGVPVFNETRDELFDALHEVFGSYARDAAAVLNEHTLAGAEFKYMPEKKDAAVITNPATPGFGVVL